MRKIAFVCAALLCGATSTLSGRALASAPPLASGTNFFTPMPSQVALDDAISLLKKGEIKNAALIADMIAQPQAVWFNGGTPTYVKQAVQKTMFEAELVRRVPTLVAYNIPFRDCAQYSAGGALDTAAYEAWIDGFAAGIGSAQAIVILEPDSLGIIPYYQGGWCQPTVTDSAGNTVPAPGASSDARLAQLNYAVDRIATKAPRALVYLDATHSAWQNVGDSASRLSLAGVARAAGFFLNISNYQFTGNEVQYGTWISSCLANSAAFGGFGGCPNQYWNGNGSGMIAQLLGPWQGVALNPMGQWSDTSTDPALNTSGINLRYAGSNPTTHFVIDTSRNGTGPENTAGYSAAPYNQPASVISGLASGNWCNPQGAGLGFRPTANTGNPLVDAYLWVKIPGESDGQCDSAGGARAWDYTSYTQPGWPTTPATQATFDPLWGMQDPAAGVWFSQQALQLAQNANPKLF